ncbi:MAG TPA: M3 family oligoendopeptidase [Anaerolineales bacterium]|nr:M3 family oligoendopeptidase [Anaerolineales bacterium]
MTELEKTTGWSLKDLFAEPVEKGLEENFARLETAVNEFESMRGVLNADMSLEDFNLAIARLEVIARLRNRARAYAELSFAENTQSSAVLNLRDRVDQVLTEVGNRLLFFELWLKELPDEAAGRLIGQSGDVRYFLETVRRFRPHTLSEAEEKIINLKDVNGIDAMVNLYEMITNAFTFELELEGKSLTLTRDELAGYFQNPSPELRARAYQELLRVYASNSTVLAQIYVHRARDWHNENLDLRRFATPIAGRNLDNDIPDAVVDTLLSVCRRNNGLFQKYFQLKAGWLGLGKLRRYDLYAPLAPSDKVYEYGEAKEMVLDSYRAFAPEVADLAKRVLDENHLDSEIRSGKRGGAFCYTVMPELTPWVMVNYDKRARAIATLAHELGHAIHALLADKHSILTQEACLPLAETASVFGEMLLTDRLLKREQDPIVRRELLASALDDAYVTVTRQAYFTLFEKDAHAMIAEGKTTDQLTARYLENLKEQFGQAVEVSDDFQWEWIAIPHMYYSPFYTYAYSFGQMLVLALYQQYRQEGEAFLPRYLRILSYGGSEAPLTVLEEAGLDVTQPTFWQGGFDFIASMLAELENLS